MSYQYNEAEIPEHVKAGRLLSERLRIARETIGSVVCPGCQAHFDATHVMKCPKCRSFIDENFKMVSTARKRRTRVHNRRRCKQSSTRKQHVSKGFKEKEQLELDFFSQGYMEYKG